MLIACNMIAGKKRWINKKAARVPVSPPFEPKAG